MLADTVKSVVSIWMCHVMQIFSFCTFHIFTSSLIFDRTVNEIHKKHKERFTVVWFDRNVVVGESPLSLTSWCSYRCFSFYDVLSGLTKVTKSNYQLFCKIFILTWSELLNTCGILGRYFFSLIEPVIALYLYFTSHMLAWSTREVKALPQHTVKAQLCPFPRLTVSGSPIPKGCVSLSQLRPHLSVHK